LRPKSPFTKTPTGNLRIALRLTPKASRNGVSGLQEDAEGAVALKVMVTSVPENGKANKALIALLAAEWKIAKSSIAIISGATDRRKVLEIETDEAETLLDRLNDWLSKF